MRGSTGFHVPVSKLEAASERVRNLKEWAENIEANRARLAEEAAKAETLLREACLELAEEVVRRA